MLLALLGKKRTKRLYSSFYDTTLENIRLTGKNWYAPPLDVYDDYDEDEIRNITTLRMDKNGEGRIGKPGAANGDPDIITFQNEDQDKLKITTSGNLELNLLTTEDYDQIIADISVLINYGICKLENKLLGVMREIYSDALIGRQYQVSIKSVTISMASTNNQDSGFGTLNVNFNIVIVDEQALRPSRKEDESDDEAGGREYKRIRDETPMKTKSGKGKNRE